NTYAGTSAAPRPSAHGANARPSRMPVTVRTTGVGSGHPFAGQEMPSIGVTVWAFSRSNAAATPMSGYSSARSGSARYPLALSTLAFTPMETFQVHPTETRPSTIGDTDANHDENPSLISTATPAR